MLELVAGVLVALAATALVLEPLGRSGRATRAASPADDEPELGDPAEADSPKVRALVALREIEFDRATGKLTEEDYRRLKARYEAQAIAAIRAEERARAGAAAAAGAQSPGGGISLGGQADAAEALIAAARGRRPVCPACGPRPEPQAAFCSSCGRSLVAPASRARCASCGSPLASGARFCADCGAAIAA